MLHGKSRLGTADKGKNIPQTKMVELRNITENATFVLPANIAITGRIIAVNKSASTQAAITVGTSSGGSQVSAGASLVAGLAHVLAATVLQPATTARTIFVNSSAWQAGVSVFIEALELPVVADISAIS
jgi:hypothetical protein